MNKTVTLTLSTLMLATALTSCGQTGTGDTLSSLSNQPATNAPINLSSDGRQGLSVLRTGSPHVLVENDYLNALTRQRLPQHYNERRNGNGKLRWAHDWAQESFRTMRTPVTSQWINAFIADGQLSPQDLVRACQADGDSPRTCANALNTASHAAVERLPDGDWLVVLAKFDTPIQINPAVIYY